MFAPFALSEWNHYTRCFVPLLRSPSISAAVDGIEIQRSRTSSEGSHLAEKSPLMMRADAYDDYDAWLIHRPVINNLYPMG